MAPNFVTLPEAKTLAGLISCSHFQEAHFAKTETERMTALAEAEKKRCLELTKQLLEFSKKQDETKESQALLETYYITLAEKDK